MVIAEGATLKRGGGETAGTEILISRPTPHTRATYVHAYACIHPPFGANAAATSITPPPRHSTTPQHHRHISTTNDTSMSNGGHDRFGHEAGCRCSNCKMAMTRAIQGAKRLELERYDLTTLTSIMSRNSSSSGRASARVGRPRRRQARAEATAKGTRGGRPSGPSPV
jgi:hypothetical protein